MNEITALFTAIGDFFTQSDWYAMVKWPFWILLGTVAGGGIYCARFGKKTLLNQAISGTLSLTAIYLSAMMAYIHLPFVRELFSELPFLSVTDEAVTLVDPISLGMGTLSPLLLRLMILLFLICLCDSFCASAKTLLSWLFSQIISAWFALALYSVITAGLTLILPCVLGRYSIVFVVGVVLVGLLLLCAKFIFTVLIDGGNPYFSSVYKFFTVNKAGSLFTVSSLCFLFTLTIMTILLSTGNATIHYAQVNTTGLWIILGLVLTTLYFFGMFFIDRKKS